MHQADYRCFHADLVGDVTYEDEFQLKTALPAPTVIASPEENVASGGVIESAKKALINQIVTVGALRDTEPLFMRHWLPTPP